MATNPNCTNPRPIYKDTSGLDLNASSTFELCVLITCMIAVRQARVPDILRRASFIRSTSTIGAFRVSLKWLKSDSGASRRHTSPTIMLKVGSVPGRERTASDLLSLPLCTLGWVVADLTAYHCHHMVYLGLSGEQCPWRNMEWWGRKRNRDRWQEGGWPGGQMPCLERNRNLFLSHSQVK